MRTQLLILVLLFPFFSVAQGIYNQNEDESELYAQTKQVNQFIRRFNGEEDLYGKRLYEGDKDFRKTKLRKRYVPNLFDLQNTSIQSQKSEFVDYINDKNSPRYFDFYGKNWFAEVESQFLYNGKVENVIMFFKIEKQNGGFKWSYTGVYADFLAEPFKTSEPEGVKFIHPMSHEIDFMSLRKVFKNYKKIEHYAHNKYSPDYLSLFFYEVKKGNLKFQSVSNVKFHVFQIKDWYFEMQYFSRKGENKGWLISNLIKIPEKDKASLIKSISYEN